MSGLSTARETPIFPSHAMAFRGVMLRSPRSMLARSDCETPSVSASSVCVRPRASRYERIGDFMGCCSVDADGDKYIPYRHNRVNKNMPKRPFPDVWMLARLYSMRESKPDETWKTRVKDAYQGRGLTQSEFAERPRHQPKRTEQVGERKAYASA
jgi:hypothetical protein